VWDYESSVVPTYASLPRQHDHPVLVSVRVSRTRPVFASAVVEIRDARGRTQGVTSVVAFEKLHGSWQQYGAPNLVAGPATSFRGACGAATPRGVRDLLCPNPWSVLDFPMPPSVGYASYTYRVGTDDLRQVDWDDIALPGSVCGLGHSVQLRKGYATVPGPADGWWSVVVIQVSGESYGELVGGLDVASVLVDCNNGGGTADGQLTFLDLVFSLSHGSLRVLGVLTPQQPLSPSASHVPLLGPGRIGHGEIVVPEFWYGPDDPTCCSTGRAKTIWVYAGGKLSAKRTIVLRQPSMKLPGSGP
jgi:hypothetical protein